MVVCMERLHTYLHIMSGSIRTIPSGGRHLVYLGHEDVITGRTRALHDRTSKEMPLVWIGIHRIGRRARVPSWKASATERRSECRRAVASLQCLCYVVAWSKE